jgi:hypothetical protein
MSVTCWDRCLLKRDNKKASKVDHDLSKIHHQHLSLLEYTQRGVLMPSIVFSPQEKQEHGCSKKTKAKAGSHVDDNDICPVNPGSSHTWGGCFLNSRHKSKKDDKKPAAGNYKFKGKHKGKSEEEIDANTMHCSNHSVSSNESGKAQSNSDSEGSFDTLLKVAINDVSIMDADSDDNTHGHDLDMAEFIDE